MDSPQFVLFICTVALLTVIPGPNFLLIVDTVPSVGKRGGYANVLGIALALCFHGVLAVGGVSIVLARSESAFTAVKCLGALYLCWMGCKSLHAALAELRGGSLRARRSGQPRGRSQSTVTGCREGFLTNALNPNTSLFYLAMFPQFLPVGSLSGTGSAALVAIHVLVSVGWFTLVIQLLGRITSAVQGEGQLRWFKGLSGCALMGMGGSFLVAAS